MLPVVREQQEVVKRRCSKRAIKTPQYIYVYAVVSGCDSPAAVGSRGEQRRAEGAADRTDKDKDRTRTRTGPGFVFVSSVSSVVSWGGRTGQQLSTPRDGGLFILFCTTAAVIYPLPLSNSFRVKLRTFPSNLSLFFPQSYTIHLCPCKMTPGPQSPLYQHNLPPHLQTVLSFAVLSSMSSLSPYPSLLFIFTPRRPRPRPRLSPSTQTVHPNSTPLTHRTLRTLRTLRRSPSGTALSLFRGPICLPCRFPPPSFSRKRAPFTRANKPNASSNGNLCL